MKYSRDIEEGVWKSLCWMESFRGEQQQEAIEVGGYRSRCLEKHVLGGELWGGAEGCT